MRTVRTTAAPLSSTDACRPADSAGTVAGWLPARVQTAAPGFGQGPVAVCWVSRARAVAVYLDDPNKAQALRRLLPALVSGLLGEGSAGRGAWPPCPGNSWVAERPATRAGLVRRLRDPQLRGAVLPSPGD